MMLNARSLMNKFDLFHSVVFSCNPDIIGVTETWCTSNILDSELQLSGYDLFRCDRKSQNRGRSFTLC